jgi:serine/threonine protein kinase
MPSNSCARGLANAVTDPRRSVYLKMVEDRGEIDGRFTAIQRLVVPVGYFSLMFTAVDRTNGQSVVLKIFHPDHRADAYRWACFKREGVLLQRFIGQPDILQVVCGHSEFVETLNTTTGFTFDVPFAYFATELAASDVLAAISSKLWDAEQTLLAFRSMCRSIQRLHAGGIVYRDTKPENFLLMHNGAVKLSDLGTARDLHDPASALLTQYDRIPGDLRYVAPEIFAHLHDVNPAFAFGADIFSLGATLFELFTAVQLGIQVFGPSMLTALRPYMLGIDRAERVNTFNDVVASIADGHPLPDLAAYGPIVPSCIRQRVEGLYKSMCAIDYRKRLTDFSRIFGQIDTCLLILRNEDKYRRWRRERQKRRAARLLHNNAEGVIS